MTQPKDTDSVEELEASLSKLSCFEIVGEICGNCGHNWYSHYWNGAGSAENSGWDSCRVSDCKCEWEDARQERTFTVDGQAVADVLAVVTPFVRQKEIEAQIEALQEVAQAYNKEPYHQKAREKLSMALWAKLRELSDTKAELEHLKKGSQDAPK